MKLTIIVQKQRESGEVPLEKLKALPEVESVEYNKSDEEIIIEGKRSLDSSKVKNIIYEGGYSIYQSRIKSEKDSS